MFLKLPSSDATVDRALGLAALGTLAKIAETRELAERIPALDAAGRSQARLRELTKAVDAMLREQRGGLRIGLECAFAGGADPVQRTRFECEQPI